MGTKKADTGMIRNNSAALRHYCTEALTTLFEHDRISDALVSNLSVQIDEIQFLRHELRHSTEFLEKGLDDKTNKLDNYVTLSQEIERRKFGTDGSPFWLYRALAEIDDRTIKDARKMELLQELLCDKKIVTAKPLSAEDFVTGMLAMPEKYAGAVYMELLNYSGNITAGLAKEVIERWHLQTRSNRQYLDRKVIAAQILEESMVGSKVEISLEVEFEAMAETKMIRISSALERELERKRRQQEMQANMRENAQKLQANVQKGVQGIQTNVKKHMPTVKEFFGNVRDKVKSIPARKKEDTVETYVQPSGTWISAEKTEPQQEYFTPPVTEQQAFGHPTQVYQPGPQLPVTEQQAFGHPTQVYQPDPAETSWSSPPEEAVVENAGKPAHSALEANVGKVNSNDSINTGEDPNYNS
jgi:hypothetical protein